MAQTKSSTTKAKSKRSASANGSGAKASGRAKSKAKPKTRSGTKPKSSSPKSSSPKSPSTTSSSRNGSSSGVTAGLKSARDTVESVGQKAGKVTGQAASKAKVPLIAGGAALVGAASGIALKSAHAKGSKVLGVKVPKPKVKIDSKDLAKAADRAASAGEQIGRLSSGIRELQGQKNGGNGEGRSPIEVVINSLTRRR